ncbi:hypothetical protein [Bradyrhizobium erythrophlei]|uniref:Uncharacterized protein n=1 Tax=Bradyrhizobium erythrophlei TaxID=1437360 RepID=A0A1M7TEK2_9BRAD|nr:hypothetical protein [Bradyrhizobium erythrophlei]SHN69116.1 hypothetical protein SAMN05444170_1497 [Bradyrhizobium erythrophlei]
MRYYSIEIEGQPPFTSLLNGVTNPNALQVEFDIPVAPFASPASTGTFVKIWGIPLSTVSQANNLRFKNIKVFGGFQKGLPLAKPAQAGLLVSGYIFQAFGNWIGVDQSLDLIILPGMAPSNTAQPTTPPNLVLNWPQGQPMSTAIQSALSAAFPGTTSKINISPNLILQAQEAAYFNSIDEFARYVKATSKSIIKTTTYPGVDIVLKGMTFTVYDNTPAAPSTTPAASTAGKIASASPQKSVLFQELIGQPTWIEAPSIQFKTMMRADLTVGDVVTLPKTIVSNSAQAQSSIINQQVAFQGGFRIQSIRHVGNFRQPTADAWVTVFDAAPLQIQAL